MVASFAGPTTQRLDGLPAEASETLHARFLVCMRGPEVARTVPLERGATVFGRTPDCDVILQGAGLSRRHFLLKQTPGGVVLEDLGSTNGTILNDEPLSRNGARALRSGDLIRVGGVALKYLEHEDLEAHYHAVVVRMMGVDALTQLKNRRFVLEQLEREIARSGRHDRALSVVLIDVDRFKRINDEHGHLAGDAALQQIGALIERSARREDCAGRLGGDEFLVLLPETHAPGATDFAQRLCARVARDSFVHGAQRIPVTISAGVAAWRPALGGAKGLLEIADRGLYAAKRAGRGRAEVGEPGAAS